MIDDWRPISPPAAQGPRGKDLPAYVSNGLVGLRVRENPLVSGVCIVSGFVGEHHEKRVEAAVAAPYPLGGDIAIDGVWAEDQPNAVKPLDQHYDFATGELISRIRISIGEIVADAEVVTLASRSHPTVVWQAVTITPSAACEIRFRARIDTREVRGRAVERRVDTPGEPEPACDGSLLWESEGAMGRLGLALLTEAPAGADRTQEPWDADGPLSTTWSLRTRRGRPLRFCTLVSLVPDVLHAQPHRQAVRLVVAAGQVGFEELRRRNRDIWRDLWRGRIRLVGAGDRWQALADAAFFYLNTSVHIASPSSTSIYGLATWRDYHYYLGHVMWDVDAFCIPPLAMMQPRAARAMLEFRTQGLPAARNTARMLGRTGLKYPWEAGPRQGEEATPGGAGSAAREDHVNLHVARAFALYADLTGDRRFMREQAWPVVSGVSDWLVDRVAWNGRGYSIHDSGGPAERAETESDDALTVMAGRLILERAVRMAEEVGEPADVSWRRVAAGLEPPLRSDGAIAQHAGYRKSEEKGATPSPLMALYPYWADIEPAVAGRTLQFYLDQWEDYVGSPMLSALYGVWAAWAGDRRLSLKLLEEGYGAFEFGRFSQILEYRLDRIPGVASGPFFANMGGFVSSLLTGFTGLNVSAASPDQWPSRAVVLPQEWGAIECDRVWVRGAPMRLEARQGADRASLTPA